MCLISNRLFFLRYLCTLRTRTLTDKTTVDWEKVKKNKPLITDDPLACPDGQLAMCWSTCNWMTLTVVTPVSGQLSDGTYLPRLIFDSMLSLMSWHKWPVCLALETWFSGRSSLYLRGVTEKRKRWEALLRSDTILKLDFRRIYIFVRYDSRVK